MKFFHFGLKQKIRNLKIVIFDFDGVFTNNLVITNENGVESVICNRSDGYGLKMLKEVGVEFIIVSSEINKAIEKRADKLKIPCYSGVNDKLEVVKEILNDKNIFSNNAAFIGNDVNDIKCMKYLGLSVAVKDAYPHVKKVSNLILKKAGGYGAVREFCEKVYRIKSNKKEMKF